MNLPRFQYLTPGTIGEAFSLLSGHGGSAAIIGGGTDLLVRMKQRLSTPAALVSLKNVDGIASVRLADGGSLEIGAGVRLADLAASPLVTGPFPGLAEASLLVASNQIRQMGTVGGNLLQTTRCLFYNRSAAWGKTVTPCFKRGGDVCHVVAGSRRCFAVYQGDLAPVLMALDAGAIVHSAAGERRVPLQGLFTGDGSAPFTLRGDEVLGSIRIPCDRGRRVLYRKYRLRDGIDFPLAGVAVSFSGPGDATEPIRVCLTGVWSAPVTVEETPPSGRTLTDDVIEAVAEAAFRAAHPLSNLEGSPKRRRAMVRHMTREILREIASRP